jgi:hypothetical protein
MRKNTQLIYKAWKNNTPKLGASISTNGQIILSYSTPILTREENGEVKLTVEKFSKTTTRQQDALRQLLRMDGFNLAHATINKEEVYRIK